MTAETPAWAEPLAPTGEERESEGDYLNSERFLATYGDRVRYAPQLKGQWFVWNGAWWEPDNTEQVRDWARQTVEGLKRWIIEADGEELKRRAAHYRASCRAERISGLLTVAATNCHVAVEELDLYPDLLPCRNGTVDLRTGELSPPDPGKFLTQGVALDYDPAARSELWERVIDEAMLGKADLKAFLQRLLGYSTTGHAREEVLVIAYGSGSNSKGTIFGTVQHVLGPMGATAPEGLFTDMGRGGQPHPERVAWLRGRRLVVSVELEKRSTLAEGLVKSLTGMDRVTAREMHGKRFEFDPTFTPVIQTNHKPRVKGTDDGIWRRLIMVPFSFKVTTKDDTLKDRLKADHAPAVLAWLVNGAREWYAHGLDRPAEVDQATTAFRAAEDTFARFWAERVEVAEREHVSVGDLFVAFSEYCKPESSGTRSDFRQRLEDAGVKVQSDTRHPRVLGYRLVRWEDDGEAAAEASDAGSAGSFVNTPRRARGEEFTKDPADPAPSNESEYESGSNPVPTPAEPDLWDGKL